MEEIFENALAEICEEENIPSYVVYDGSDNLYRAIVEAVIADKMGISKEELREHMDYQNWVDYQKALS